MIEPHSASSAELLRQNKQSIEKIWTARVWADSSAPDATTAPILQQSLGNFVDHLSAVLARKDPSIAAKEAAHLAHQQDKERAAQQGYHLAALLKEFSVLREVVVEVLLSTGQLSHEDRTLLDQAIDAAITAAAKEFVLAQNAEMNNALSSAESSNVALTHFAAVAAHDLKSPLATIIGFVDSLQDEEFQEKLGPEGGQMLSRVSAAAHRMNTLIDTMLEYARLGSSERVFESIPVDQLAKAAVENLHDQIEATEAHITIEPLPVLLCDAPLVTQLFQNLIANALKFRSPKPPDIRISANFTGRNWEFIVKDNGIGFDPAKKEEIFDLYKKLHAPSEYQGSGIGLATCKRIVELHHGKIRADSTPGMGSTFTFTLGG